MLTRQIERAQRKVESHNFDARKNLLEYDDVANDQRKVIYRQRTEIMSTDDIGASSRTCAPRSSPTLVAQYIPPDSVEEQWDVAGLEEAFQPRLRRATRASRPGSPKTRRGTARRPSARLLGRHRGRLRREGARRSARR